MERPKHNLITRATREIVGTGASLAFVGMSIIGDIGGYVGIQLRRIPYALRGEKTEVIRTSTPDGLADFGYAIQRVPRTY